MPRFFVEKENILSDRIRISGEDFNHIKNVLRLRKGEKLTACDGAGTEYTALLEGFEPDAAYAKILETGQCKTEPPIDVTIFQGIPKSDKMDFIIQKSVELGIKRIVPVINERTVVKIDEKRDAEKKAGRWQKIALEAAKQSNRGIIPTVNLPVSFAEALTLAKTDELSIIPYEKEEKNTVKKCLADKSGCKRISFFVGPEGGFSEKEIETAVQSGLVPVSLGPRILRTETAGIAVLSILMYEIGDVG